MKVDRAFLKKNTQKTIAYLQETFDDAHCDCLLMIIQTIVKALTQGNKVLLCGNGGSAADSQHIAAEFVGRFLKERKAYPAIALTTDTSILTAVGNDYGFDTIFARQVEALGHEGDILIGISTSGNSPNVIKAAVVAREKKMKVICFTGRGGGALASNADILFTVESPETPAIQTGHQIALHALCDGVEKLLEA